MMKLFKTVLILMMAFQFSACNQDAGVTNPANVGVQQDNSGTPTQVDNQEVPENDKTNPVINPSAGPESSSSESTSVSSSASNSESSSSVGTTSDASTSSGSSASSSSMSTIGTDNCEI